MTLRVRRQVRAVRFTVHPGKAQLFREKAAECLGAARSNLAGTAVYGWFMTPAGERCTVIECYDGMAGLGTHIQQVGKIVGALQELAATDVILFGDVSADVQARVAELNTRFFGHRRFGRLNAPAAPDGSIGEAGVYALARFKPQAEKTERFKELAAERFSIASGEPGTVGYEWFVNADETEFATLDIYRDLAPLLDAITRY